LTRSGSTLPSSQSSTGELTPGRYTLCWLCGTRRRRPRQPNFGETAHTPPRCIEKNQPVCERTHKRRIHIWLRPRLPSKCSGPPVHACFRSRPLFKGEKCEIQKFTERDRQPQWQGPTVVRCAQARLSVMQKTRVIQLTVLLYDSQLNMRPSETLAAGCTTSRTVPTLVRSVARDGVSCMIRAAGPVAMA